MFEKTENNKKGNRLCMNPSHFIIKRFDDNRRLIDSEKMLEIPVRKGWKKGTKITFQNEGDERENVLPAG